MKKLFILGLLLCLSLNSCQKDDAENSLNIESNIKNGFDLVKAVNTGNEGATILVPEGVFYINEPLTPKKGMIIKGSGIDKTIITNANVWNVGISDLPDDAVNPSSVNQMGYLINLGNQQKKIVISGLTLKAPKLHGAIYGFGCDELEVFNVKIEDVLWSGIRIYAMSDGKIHDNVFINAGGEYLATTGGAIYTTWVGRTKFYNNRFERTANSTRNFYGIKGREGKNCEIYQNTIKVDFSIEFPHDNDADMNIHHNYLTGTVSIPKYAGGEVPPSGSTFHIHHNYFSSTYSLEWSRRGVEIDHNLFNYDTNKDWGNLISCWTPYTDGSTKFHDNLIKNPGRGVFWSEEVYNGFQFYNNHVKTNTTITPRNDGLFGFNSATNFSTIKIENNIIECTGISRPLMRNTQSYSSTISNNKLVNVSDTNSYGNTATGATQGPITEVKFRCGVNNEFNVDGWNIQ